MDINLNDCKELPSVEYRKLVKPIFKGQTRVDPETNKYWMVFESENILYKFQHTL